ncbi:MAG: hypothetical protein QOH81_1870 [Sphingomonadales bacterium]|jgi:hypothetical protein|nr:hypothetical protein [Sphingomonadales bacterium]
MKLGDRLEAACEYWLDGAALILVAGLVAAIAIGCTYLTFGLLGGALGRGDRWAQMWAAGSAILWLPLVTGKAMKLLRRRSAAGPGQDRRQGDRRRPS